MPDASSPQPPSKKIDVDHYFRMLHRLATEGSVQLPSATVASEDTSSSVDRHTVATAPSVDINNEIAREQKLKNDNTEQDIRLKRETLNRLFVFLTAETGLIFAFAFFQAIHWPAHFHLDE